VTKTDGEDVSVLGNPFSLAGVEITYEAKDDNAIRFEDATYEVRV